MTEYTLIFNKLNRIEFLKVTAFSLEEAIDRLLDTIPGAKLIEVQAHKPSNVQQIVYINNVIKVDFKLRKRVA